ncbi:MAG: nucleotidyltransferase domain-containing protein [Anaerolineales bacterium]
MIERLFSSRVRIGLLKQFLLNPDKKVHARFLSKLVEAQYNAVWKELRNLENAGLLLSIKQSNQRLFWLNPGSPILEELRRLILKTVAVGDYLRESFEKISDIETAFIYGSFARGDLDANSDLDLMIIGDLPLTALAPVITQIETSLDRSVNYTTLAPEEWSERLTSEDPFILRLLSEPRIMLIGSENALRTIASTETN